jgi:thymidine phosphorylase
VTSTASGFIAAVDTYAIGDGVCGIGGGRVKTEDGVDHAVGYSTEVKIGDRVQQGDTLGFVYCRTKSDSDAVLEKLRNAYKISEEPVEPPALIRAII